MTTSLLFALVRAFLFETDAGASPMLPGYYQLKNDNRHGISSEKF